jgi:hypothetical protein
MYLTTTDSIIRARGTFCYCNTLCLLMLINVQINDEYQSFLKNGS